MLNAIENKVVVSVENRYQHGGENDGQVFTDLRAFMTVKVGEKGREGMEERLNANAEVVERLQKEVEEFLYEKLNQLQNAR